MSDTTTADIEASTEASNDSARHQASAEPGLSWGVYLIILSGVGVVGNGLAMLYRVFFSSGFEAGVETLGGVTKAELAATNHELFHYVNHLHVNVAGLMVAAGVAIVALAWYGIRRGHRWALGTTVVIPVVFLAHSLQIHQTAQFSFDALVHLGPGLIWLPALIGGSVLSYRALESQNAESIPEEGDDR